MSTGQDSALFPCPQETTLTPQARALHNNFRLAMGGLRRELVRSIFFLRLIADSKVYRRLGYVTFKLSPEQYSRWSTMVARLRRLNRGPEG